MSARLVKKVLNEQQHFPPQQEDDDDDDEDEDEDRLNDDSTNRSSINPFDLLNDHDSEPEYQEEDLESAKETSTRYDDKEGPSLLKNTAVVSTSNTKSKKKKKKKNKNGSVANKTGGEKDLDEILEDLSLDANSSGEQDVSSKARAVSAKDKNKSVKHQAILQVDPKCLNAENELRRIFGSKVVKSFEASNEASSSRQIRGVRRGHYNLRKTVLVTPANHWPRWDGSLSMEFLETKNGYNYFKYAHSSSYSQAQSAFEATKAINDLNGVASLLMHHPYHLDSLLTMAEYFKVVGEQQMSADAIAKCLYALECAWHPMFTPLQGNCQLLFGHDTNKPMFTALFTHMKNLDRRGCHRSALEVCKLLLSLDSDDPMGAIFCIDYFALRAEEYAWLEKFAADYESINSLYLLPNFSFSLSICRFYLEREEASKDACIDAKKSSLDYMKQALLLHPSVIRKLVEKVPLKDRIWTDILKHPFFQSDQTRNVSLDHLISIYTERNYLIWRLPDLQKLLSDAAQLVIGTLEDIKSEVDGYAAARTQAFSSVKNEYGHLLVSDFSDKVASIPPENLQQFMGPPRMGEGMPDENQFANLHAHGNGHAPRGVANRNALAVLFESMLPWVTYEDREGGGPDDNQHDDDHGQNNQ
ncbi:hypothetical protein RIF29_16592 [Crotalaria pallida]|uniref:Transcription factor 25 n=1 Tax=Crotalaria pallida TaxID=3830 RepID=A0AAN9FLE0_CROPI